MFVTDHVIDSGDAIGRYRDVILPAFDAPAIEQLYSDLFAVPLAHDVNEDADLSDLIQQILQNCANQGAHLPRLLARIVRVRAARRDLVEKLAPVLNLQPVLELADLLFRRGCPDALRDQTARGFEATDTHRKAYHLRGREAWIDVLVWLEEQSEGGHPRPPLLDYLERIARAWRVSNPADAAALDELLEAHRATHHVPPPADDEAPPRTPPGRRDSRDRTRGKAPSRTAAEPARPLAPAARCALPIALLPANHATVVATDAGEWFTIEADGGLVPLPATGPFAAAIVDSSGIVTLACWKSSIKQLRGTAWEEHVVASPPTALALTERGVVAGDVAGSLTLVSLGSRIRGGELATTAPVLELGVAGVSLALIDSLGLLATTSWPLRGAAALAPIDTAELGRPLALRPGVRAATLVAIGERGIGVIDGASLTSVAAAPAVRTVTAFRGHDRACVVTDRGAAWIVDASLARVAPIRIHGAGIEGTAAGPDGNILAWTTDGDLHSIGPDGSVRRLIDGGVVLAAPDRDDASGYIAIHWTAATGPRVSRGRTAWT